MNLLKFNKEVVYLLSGICISWIMISNPEEVRRNHPAFFLETETIPSPPYVIENNTTNHTLKIKSPGKNNYRLHVSVNGGEWMQVKEFYAQDIFKSAENYYFNIPTSPRWKPPVTDFPAGAVYRFFTASPSEKKRGKIITLSFFRQKHYLPIVSVVADSSDLFGSSRGIYVQGAAIWENQPYLFTVPWWKINANYLKRGAGWERPCHVQFFNTKNILQFESDAGIRIHGNATRAYPQKSLRITSGKKYKSKNFEFPFFPGNSYQAYKHIIIRNGGNDWDRTMIADGVIHYLCRDSIMDTQAYSPYILYINGSYWGIHSLREKIDEDYLAEKYNIKKNKINIIEGRQLVKGSNSSQEDFNNFLEACKKIITPGESNFTFINENINYRNFLRYIALQLYFANTDWPGNNVKLYRFDERNRNDDRDKWTFVIWDMDYAYGYTGEEAVSTDMFDYIQRSSSSVGIIFNALMKFPKFRSDLHDELDFLLANELSRNNQLNVIQQFEDEISKEIPWHCNRWRKPASAEQWKKNIENFRDFVNKRETIVRKQTEKYLQTAK